MRGVICVPRGTGWYTHFLSLGHGAVCSDYRGQARMCPCVPVCCHVLTNTRAVNYINPQRHTTFSNQRRGGEAPGAEALRLSQEAWDHLEETMWKYRFQETPSDKRGGENRWSWREKWQMAGENDWTDKQTSPWILKLARIELKSKWKTVIGEKRERALWNRFSLQKPIRFFN